MAVVRTGRVLAALAALAALAVAAPSRAGDEGAQGDGGDEAAGDDGGGGGDEGAQGDGGDEAAQGDGGDEAAQGDGGDGGAGGDGGGGREQARVAGGFQPRRATRVIFLPSTGYNPDDGFGAGVFGNVERAVPAGDAATRRPYLWFLDLVARLWLKPAPRGWELYLGGSWFPYADGRTETAYVLTSNGRAYDWWFGLGNDTVRDQTRASAGDPVRDYWHRFALYQVRSSVRLFRGVAGPLRLLAGIGVQGNDVVIKSGTLLEQDAAGGEELHGLGGSAYGTLELGVQVDTRDDRMDPAHGGTLTGVAQTNVGQVDGFGVFGRLMVDLRGYLGTPGGEVVLAAELGLQAAVGEVPFHEMGVLAGFEVIPRTLTGLNGLRGRDRGRLRGPLTALTHLELRFRPPGFYLIKGFFVRPIPALWVDGARADVPGVDPPPPVLFPGVGGGLRVVFNELSVARVDVGTGPDPTWTDEGLVQACSFRFYASLNHSF